MREPIPLIAACMNDIANWVSVGASVLIVIVTSVYVYYTRKYVRFTETLMRTNSQSFKLSRDVYLEKEQPFLYIEAVKRGASKVQFQDLSITPLHVFIRNGGTVLGSLLSFTIELRINSLNPDYVHAHSLPIRIQPIEFSEPATLYVPANHSRYYESLFVFGEHDLSSEDVECIADVNLVYMGTPR